MNRSHYVARTIDQIDRAIITTLESNGRMTIRELAAQVGLSSPSVTDRILKLEDAGAILGYSVTIDPKVFGLGISAHVRMRAMPGEVKRLAAMLEETPEIIEADRITGEECFLVKVVVKDIDEFQTVVDRFLPFSSITTSIIQSQIVTRRLPKL